MVDVTETRWKRYGKDRVYVKVDGVDIGWIDLQSRSVTVSVAEHQHLLAACAARWLTDAPDPPLVAPATPVVQNPDANAASLAATGWADLSNNVPGGSARAKRNEVNAEAPVLNFIARVLGVKTDERSWRIGAKAEGKVADVLAKLPSEWRVLHAVEVGDRGSDIDHVVVGPAGVFTLNTKCHPDAKARITENAVVVNGHKQPYLHKSRHEAQRASKLLSAAAGRPVPVRGVVVFVDLIEFDVKQQPRDVIVTTRKRLHTVLCGMPTTLSSREIETIHSLARRSTTWRTGPATSSV